MFDPRIAAYLYEQIQKMNPFVVALSTDPTVVKYLRLVWLRTKAFEQAVTTGGAQC